MKLYQPVGKQMALHLEFEKLLTYDIGELGITVAVTIELKDKSESFDGGG